MSKCDLKLSQIPIAIHATMKSLAQR